MPLGVLAQSETWCLNCARLPSMKTLMVGVALAAACAGCGGDSDSATGPSGPGSTMTFFVSSAKSTTGNIGGLRGADSVCQNLASAAGAGSRIGSGPWTNATGAVVARSVTELHSRTGDPALFVDEKGQRINGQWQG